jgi:hypothetical protein
MLSCVSRRVLRVSIVANEVPDSEGHVRHASVFGRMTPDFHDSGVTRTKVERLVRVALAGDIAVARSVTRCWWRGRLLVSRRERDAAKVGTRFEHPLGLLIFVNGRVNNA